MGDFLIQIASVGGHGCERAAKAGETFYGCGKFDCPDCYAAELVAQFNRRFPVHYATFTHWPSALNKTMGRSYHPNDEVVDDLFYKTKDGYSTPTLRKRIKGDFVHPSSQEAVFTGPKDIYFITAEEMEKLRGLVKAAEQHAPGVPVAKQAILDLIERVESAEVWGDASIKQATGGAGGSYAVVAEVHNIVTSLINAE